MPVSRAGRSVLCLTRLRCYRALYFSGQNPEVVREPAEQLSLRRVRRQISDQLALGCLDAKLLQVHLHILHGIPQPTEKPRRLLTGNREHFRAEVHSSS